MSGPALQAPLMAGDDSPIYTVTELTRRIRDTLERHVGAVWVSGEVTNLRVPASGHWYFTLKDESAQVSAVMWRGQAAALRFEVKDGLSIVAQGDVTVYEPRGQYQLVVRRMEPIGLGALQLAFLQLKDKLAAEGLFDPQHKKPLPRMPLTLALVTSPTGAAVHDMLKVIQRRFPPVRILICPVRVQGSEAAPEIAEAIRRVNRIPEVEVMIVGRGGGSIEDLWPFNEEIVARAIFASRIPVVSAVGHETDFTIADFVADARALTPTDAGNLVVPEIRELASDLAHARDRMAQALLAQVRTARVHLDSLARHYDPRRPLERIRAHEQHLDDLLQRLLHTMENIVHRSRQRLDAATARLESLSPLAVLGRGYSITFKDGRFVRDAAALQPGDLVRTRLHKGAFTARVENTDVKE